MGLRYCPRCRFEIEGLPNLVLSGRVGSREKDDPSLVSPKILGLKQGGIMLLAGIFIVPILGVLHSLLGFPSEIIGLAAVTFFLGGILRALYALIFQPHIKVSPESAGFKSSLRQTFLQEPVSGKTLPQPAEPIANWDQMMAERKINWRETEPLGVERETSQSRERE